MTSMTRRTLIAASLSLPASTLALGLAGEGARADVPSFSGQAGIGGLDRNSAWDAARLVDATGSSVRLTSGKTLVFVNLWANWCSGCIREMTSLRRMGELVGHERMDILLVSHPSNWVQDQRFAELHRLDLPLLALASTNPDWVISGVYDAKPGEGYEVPQSLVFDGRSGEIIWSLTGMQDWDSPALVGKVSSLANR